MKRICMLAIASLSCTNALAVKYGSEVAASEYKDYIVRFELENHSKSMDCGGLLIAGDYIVTAAHCVADLGADDSGKVTIDYFIDNGASNKIRVYQNVETYSTTGTGTTYQVIPLFDTVAKENIAKAAADTELAYVKAQYPAADWSLNDLLVDHDYYDSVWAKDIALLKLATPLSQVSHATLEPTFNPRSNTFPITNGQDVTFRGWGVDENGTRPRVMNKTTVSFVLADYDYLPNNPNGDGGKGACANDGNQCDYIMRDRLNGYATTIGSTPYTGDSGTPLVIDGTDNVVAFAKSTNGTVSTQFTHLGFYFDIIREAINQVAAPKSIEMEVESGYAASETKTFMVQNLTASSETLSPYVIDSTGMFDISGCAVTLQSGESCEVTMVLNKDKQAITEKKNATIYLGDSLDTQFPISYTIASNNIEVPESGNKESGGSESGGSFGLFSLFALVGLTLRIRKRKT